jgi:pimeloyl-ACP methyl ester carboxylesterase
MKLFFRKTGKGFPLIILHGLYGCSDNWLTVSGKLSEKYEVFVPDMRNHGKSPHDPTHSYEAMSADILEFMDDGHLDKCVLLGHSMGGKVALSVAAIAPERIKCLIIDDIAPVDYSRLPDYSPQLTEHLNIVNTLLSTDTGSFSSLHEIERVWSANIGDPAVRRFLLKNVRRDGNRRLYLRINIPAIANHLPHLLNGTERFNPATGLRIENIPVLFLKGERSPYIQPSMFPVIRQIIPKAEIVTIPDAGHWLHVEQPERVLNEISRFLSGKVS